MQTEQLLCWSSMTDTEHSKTSSSNEEEQVPAIIKNNKFSKNGGVVDNPS